MIPDALFDVVTDDTGFELGIGNILSKSRSIANI